MYKKLIINISIMIMINFSSVSFADNVVTRTLNADNASFVVIVNKDRMEVVTYAYKSAGETCSFLQKKGIMVTSVENYTTNAKTGQMTITFKEC